MNCCSQTVCELASTSMQRMIYFSDFFFRYFFLEKSVLPSKETLLEASSWTITCPLMPSFRLLDFLLLQSLMTHVVHEFPIIVLVIQIN